MPNTHKPSSATGQAAAEAGHEDVVAVLSEAGAPLRPRTACARRTETDDALGQGTPPREFEQFKRIFRYCRTKNGYGTSSDVKNRCTQYMPFSCVCPFLFDVHFMIFCMLFLSVVFHHEIGYFAVCRKHYSPV